MVASEVRDVIERGAACLARSFDAIDNSTLAIADYLARNWELAALSGARSVARGRPPVASWDPLLQRLLDPEALPPPRPAAPPHPWIEPLVWALHSDRAAPSSGELEALGTLAATGGYAATHAALAIGWMRELCGDTAPLDELTVQVVTGMAQELARDPSVRDLGLEQAACLVYLGASRRVPADMSLAIVAAQQKDGGWAEHGPDGATSWHATLLAIWALSGLQDPRGRGASMIRL